MTTNALAERRDGSAVTEWVSRSTRGWDLTRRRHDLEDFVMTNIAIALSAGAFSPGEK